MNNGAFHSHAGSVTYLKLHFTKAIHFGKEKRKKGTNIFLQSGLLERKVLHIMVMLFGELFGVASGF